MAQVVLEHVTKRFDQTEVIRDVSLDVRDREFVVLVGPSGCGKSTVLRMIAGLEGVSEGRIEIGDRVVNDVPPKDRDIAMVFQNYALYPHMNVYDNMAFGLKMRKFPKAQIDQRVREAAKILDLESLLDRKPKQLSGGQRQRVALGRAIVRDPKVFLMDEPLSNLDAKLRVQMRTEISRLHQRLDATTIYVTHDQVEAMTMGDRIVILHGGVIQQVDAPTIIYQSPVNLFVAGFIGQMNFLNGRLDQNRFLLPDGSGFDLPEALAAKASGYQGKPVVLGVRPEHFYGHEPGGVTLNVTPDLVEVLGSEKLVHFRLADSAVTARVAPDCETPSGQPMALTLDLENALLFDPDTTNRIG